MYPLPMTVDIRHLDIEEKINLAGKQTTANASSINRCIYKRTNETYIIKMLQPQFLEGYTGPGTISPVNWHPIETLIEDIVPRLRTGNAWTRASLLWHSCSWPVAIVENSGHRIGILQRWHPSAGIRGQQSNAWPSFQYVGMPPNLAGLNYFCLPEKLARLGDLLLIVAELHEQGIVVGDLRARNALTLPPTVHHVHQGRRVYLVDTDSFWVDGQAAFANVPPGEGEHSAFKIGDPRRDGELMGHVIFYSIAESLQPSTSKFRENASMVLPNDQIERIHLLAHGQGRGLQSMTGLAHLWSAMEQEDGRLFSLATGDLMPIEPSLEQQSISAPPPDTSGPTAVSTLGPKQITSPNTSALRSKAMNQSDRSKTLVGTILVLVGITLGCVVLASGATWRTLVVGLGGLISLLVGIMLLVRRGSHDTR